MVRPLRRRHYPADRVVGAVLVSGVLVPTILGSGVIAAMSFWVLPTSAELNQPNVLIHNLISAAIYAGTAVPAAAVCAYFWMTIPVEIYEPEAGKRLLVSMPARIATAHGAVWLVGSMVFAAVNIGAPWVAATLGVSVLLGGFVTTAIAYWMSSRALRGSLAKVLTNDPPTQRHGPGLRLRSVTAWLLGTGVPIVNLLLVALSAMVIAYPGHRLAWAVLSVVALTVISGLATAMLTGSAIADPIDEITRGMQRVERGDFSATVPVYDASELGLLQAGFNTMVAGLRERQRLRELFGRQVGRDVARLAEQAAAETASPIAGSVIQETAVLFVDLIGSSRLAARLKPDELVEVLNAFFAVVVDVVEDNDGWVNKFEGDAALAVFGVPTAVADAAGKALCAARSLGARLNTIEVRVGIGVSAGTTVAGNIGAARRYEYTVVGDPVNEASRLSELAKEIGGVAASSSAIERAALTEASHWQVIRHTVLRGRDSATGVAVPYALNDR